MIRALLRKHLIQLQLNTASRCQCAGSVLLSKRRVANTIQWSFFLLKAVGTKPLSQRTRLKPHLTDARDSTLTGFDPFKIGS